MRCWSGSRAARRATSAVVLLAAARASRRRRARAAPGGAQDVGQQLGGVEVRARRRRPRRAGRRPRRTRPGSAAAPVSCDSMALEAGGQVGLHAGLDDGSRSPSSTCRGCRTCSRCGGRRSGSPGSCRSGSARSGRRCGPATCGRRSPRRPAVSWAAWSSRARRMRMACSRFCSWRLLVLAAGHDAGRDVGDADRRVGGVHRLAAGPGGAVDVDAQVLLLDRDVDLLGLRA